MFLDCTLRDGGYYSKKHISQFLEDMFVDDVEVLGATENFEIEHHLSSFCIAMSGGVLRSEKFKKYWKSYRCSDVRPKVIKTGEMELSKVLKRVISSPDNFSSLYDTTHAALTLKRDPDLLGQVGQLARSSTLVDWPRFSFSAVSKNIVTQYLHSSAVVAGAAVNVEVDQSSSIKLQYVSSVREFHDFLCNSISNAGELDNSLSETIRNEIISNYIACFAQGSQIHQNNLFLHRIGLPIIKLDGLYRGMFSARDIEKLAEDLVQSQQDEFRRVMYSRPFGGSVLYGWKRTAFLSGLI